jgi:hypothetical protein
VELLDFREIAELINKSKTSNIELAPEASGEGWALHRGLHRLHTATYPFHVFSLSSRATKDAIALVGRKLKDVRQADVVYPPSLETRFPSMKTELREARGAWSTKQYLASFIRDELSTYTAKLKNEAPKFYVDPFVTTPSGIHRKIPNPLKSLLLEDSFGSGESRGALGILLAEPGQGKTYMSRYLVSQVVNSDKNLVPLMIDSSQWAAMSITDQSSLWKTIAHTFRHFGATIGWLEGNEDQFLRTTLKADLFRIIFDGFDEYVLRNQGEVQALEVLEALAELASETGTRIVVTSRTSFWNANLSQEEAKQFVKEAKAYEFRIQPFDRNHATRYFETRLLNERVGPAMQVWSSLSNRSADFAGRGFVLSLVADLIERDESAKGISDGANAVLWLVHSLCRRETLRQQLPYGGADQVEALSAGALEIARGNELDTDVLSLAFAVVKPELGLPGPDLIEKLKSHPLIAFRAVDRRWEFREEQIRIALIADKIVNAGTPGLRDLVDHLRLEPAVRQDLGAMIVDIVSASDSGEPIEDVLKALIGGLGTARSKVADSWSESHWLAAVIALHSVERCSGKGDHKERKACLIRLLNESEIAGLAFNGTVARFDFRNTHFRKCRFDRVTWANCEFDKDTVFRNCQFIGGATPNYTRGFGLARFEECLIDTEAMTWINMVQVAEGKRRYTADDLAADIHSVINKFVVRGGLGLRTVHSRHLKSGVISQSKHRDAIISVLMSVVLEEHHVSGSSGPGIHVRPQAEEAVRFYTSNNFMTGPLRDAYERLRRKLDLEK